MRSFISGTVRTSLLNSVPVTDDLFDLIYPIATQLSSRARWTPVSAALRAAALLAPGPGMRVLDIGAGPGKLCCIGALVSNAVWYGVEHDAELVDTALASAKLLGVTDRVQFRASDMTAVDWTEFDSIYLFNPFEAALFAGDSENETAWQQFDRQVSSVEERLARMPRGARVVTFHGFGGKMPASYVRVSSESVDSGELELWINDIDGASRPIRAEA